MSEQPNEIFECDDLVTVRRRGRRRAARDYFQLIRLPNVFTAMADVAMGFLLVQPVAGIVDACALALLMASSGLLYIAGVVYNDVFDVDLDRVERPERPLPSGRISVRIASRIAGKAMLWGVGASVFSWFFVFHMQTITVASILAALILLYNARLKHTPAGPLAMGGCRMLNVMLGMNVVNHPMRSVDWLVACGIGVYVAGITWFARTENQRSSRLHLASGAGVMVLGIGMLAWFPRWGGGDLVIPLLQEEPNRWPWLMAILGTLIMVRCLLAIASPTPARVRFAVTQSILSLVILDAAVSYAVRGPFCGMMVALLLVPALFAGRWIEST